MTWLKRAADTWWGGLVHLVVGIALVIAVLYGGVSAVVWGGETTGLFDSVWRCGDFDTQVEAQETLEHEERHSDERSIDNLDNDGNGKACESTTFADPSGGEGATQDGGEECDPSYPDDCLDPSASDYDCEGGEGDGPEYVAGPVNVQGVDPFGLDRDGNGTGCEG